MMIDLREEYERVIVENHRLKNELNHAIEDRQRLVGERTKEEKKNHELRLEIEKLRVELTLLAH